MFFITLLNRNRISLLIHLRSRKRVMITLSKDKVLFYEITLQADKSLFIKVSKSTQCLNCKRIFTFFKVMAIKKSPFIYSLMSERHKCSALQNKTKNYPFQQSYYYNILYINFHIFLGSLAHNFSGRCALSRVCTQSQKGIKLFCPLILNPPKNMLGKRCLSYNFERNHPSFFFSTFYVVSLCLIST